MNEVEQSHLRVFVHGNTWPLIQRYINEAVAAIQEEAFAADAGPEKLYAAKGARRVRELVVNAINATA